LNNCLLACLSLYFILDSRKVEARAAGRRIEEMDERYNTFPVQYCTRVIMRPLYNLTFYSCMACISIVHHMRQLYPQYATPLYKL